MEKNIIMHGSGRKVHIAYCFYILFGYIWDMIPYSIAKHNIFTSYILYAALQYSTLQYIQIHFCFLFIHLNELYVVKYQKKHSNPLYFHHHGKTSNNTKICTTPKKKCPKYLPIISSFSLSLRLSLAKKMWTNASIGIYYLVMSYYFSYISRRTNAAFLCCCLKKFIYFSLLLLPGNILKADNNNSRLLVQNGYVLPFVFLITCVLCEHHQVFFLLDNGNGSNGTKCVELFSDILFNFFLYIFFSFDLKWFSNVERSNLRCLLNVLSICRCSVCRIHSIINSRKKSTKMPFIFVHNFSFCVV